MSGEKLKEIINYLYKLEHEEDTEKENGVIDFLDIPMASQSSLETIKEIIKKHNKQLNEVLEGIKKSIKEGKTSYKYEAVSSEIRDSLVYVLENREYKVKTVARMSRCEVVHTGYPFVVSW